MFNIERDIPTLKYNVQELFGLFKMALFEGKDDKYNGRRVRLPFYILSVLLIGIMVLVSAVVVGVMVLVDYVSVLFRFVVGFILGIFAMIIQLPVWFIAYMTSKGNRFFSKV